MSLCLICSNISCIHKIQCLWHILIHTFHCDSFSIQNEWYIIRMCWTVLINLARNPQGKVLSVCLSVTAYVFWLSSRDCYSAVNPEWNGCAVVIGGSSRVRSTFHIKKMPVTFINLAASVSTLASMLHSTLTHACTIHTKRQQGY